MYAIYKSPDFGKYSLYTGTISNVTENAITFVPVDFLCKVFLKPVISAKAETPILFPSFLTEHLSEKHSAF